MPPSPSERPERPLPRPASFLVRVIVGSALRRGGGGRPSKRVATTVTQTWSAERLVDVGAEDDVGVGVGGFADQLGRLADLDQREVLAAGDREQDRAGALHRGLEQRRGDRFFGGEHRPALAGAHADPEQRPAGVGHDRAHVGEVEVDHGGQGDQVGDPLHALAQDVVGDLEGLDHRGLLVEHLEQAVVGDDDQRVDLGGERLDPLARLVAAAAALEAERLGDDADGQGADLAGEAGDDRGGAGARAAAGAGGDEDHVGALEQALDLVLLLEGRAVADLGVGTGAEAAGLLLADVDGDVGDADLQRLKIGVDGHELDARDPRLDHAVDRVDAGTADADHADHRCVRLAAAGRRVLGLLAPVARAFRRSARARGAGGAAPRRRLV